MTTKSDVELLLLEWEEKWESAVPEEVRTHWRFDMELVTDDYDAHSDAGWFVDGFAIPEWYEVLNFIPSTFGGYQYEPRTYDEIVNHAQDTELFDQIHADLKSQWIEKMLRDVSTIRTLYELLQEFALVWEMLRPDPWQPLSSPITMYVRVAAKDDAERLRTTYCPTSIGSMLSYVRVEDGLPVLREHDRCWASPKKNPYAILLRLHELGVMGLSLTHDKHFAITLKVSRATP